MQFRLKINTRREDYTNYKKRFNAQAFFGRQQLGWASVVGETPKNSWISLKHVFAVHPTTQPIPKNANFIPDPDPAPELHPVTTYHLLSFVIIKILIISCMDNREDLA
jgi:hypothetical protein